MLSDQSSSSFRGGHWHIQPTDKACNKITKEKSAKRSEFQFRCLYLKRTHWVSNKECLEAKRAFLNRPYKDFLSQWRTKSHLSQNKIDTVWQNYGVDRHISCFMSAVRMIPGPQMISQIVPQMILGWKGRKYMDSRIWTVDLKLI